VIAVAPLSRGLELLESALGYALASAALVTPPLLSGPTPCAGWDVRTLLAHLGDSIAVLHQSLAGPGPAVADQAVAGPARPDPDPQPGRGADPVAVLQREAARLLADCAAAGPAEHRIPVGGHALAGSIVAVTGALEITVHGWDVAAACGGPRPVPPGLAIVLLPVAQLFVPPGTRPGLFAGPVRVPAPAGPGDQLVAFLGRRPR
jgi:uncharacterized protein (TIGR03086 family)